MPYPLSYSQGSKDYRLADQACPVNVWLSKLTTLDMTPMGWLGCKTSTQINHLDQHAYPCSLISSSMSCPLSYSQGSKDYRLEDQACPVNVWLGKLTMLDMTPLGWLGRKISTQINHLLRSCSLIGSSMPCPLPYSQGLGTDHRCDAWSVS